MPFDNEILKEERDTQRAREREDERKKEREILSLPLSPCLLLQTLTTGRVYSVS